jgi:hypothetical protein
MREAARLTAGGGRSAKSAPLSADLGPIVRHLVRTTAHFRHMVDVDKLACGRPFADAGGGDRCTN